MNGLLVDTHVLLWWLGEPDRLPKRVADRIADAGSTVLVSAASLWEMAIKKSIGRLDMPANLFDVLEQEHIAVLEVNGRHALAVADLPRLHDDPFDRMLVAQARLESLILVTSDRRLAQYEVPCEVF